ncbi:hypothetical protein SSX86_016426 [Deinandra increscens subsp. villosa]|uniref:Uncharacterized protein n=1 Tax=Deinandra increscens subsp. villosa TaxID=3103831 RepID=A0AAP0D271_9ASTR
MTVLGVLLRVGGRRDDCLGVLDESGKRDDCIGVLVQSDMAVHRNLVMVVTRTRHDRNPVLNLNGSAVEFHPATKEPKRQIESESEEEVEEEVGEEEEEHAVEEKEIEVMDEDVQTGSEEVQQWPENVETNMVVEDVNKDVDYQFIRTATKRMCTSPNFGSRARGLYDYSDVYIFDDPFSIVDVHTGAHMLKVLYWYSLKCVYSAISSTQVRAMKAQFAVGWLDHEQVKSEDELPVETAWSEEQECVPLKQRLKMLRAKAASVIRKEVLIPAISPVDGVVNKGDVLCDSLEFYPDQDGGKGRSGSARQHGMGHTFGSSLFQDRILSERQEIENAKTQDNSVTHLPTVQRPSSSNDIESSEYFNEDLDHFSLKERQKMLLSRLFSILNSSDPSTNPVGIILQNSRLGSSDICGIRSAIGKNAFGKGDANIYASSEALKPGLLNGIASGAPTWTYQHEGTTITKSIREARPCSSGRSDINEKHLLSSSCKDVHIPALKPLPNVKVETVDSDLEFPNKSKCSQISVKVEPVNSSENLEDIIDHMMLGDRMRLLASRKVPQTFVYENFESGNDHKSKLSKSSKPFVIKRPHKRRRTATDSVETALEEDAPGLLKVLIEKGVLVDEIKLYGANEGEEALNESLIDESFSDLEDVITKIFSQQQSLFKFAPIRCARGEKTSYCLACLISLVEQARYLRVRKWPVEWGWCRDLQSFIFVFNKHNRIVLERPEYGYATYFFELIDALPVNWQIKRLVTTMKLTSITRITLIENRSLKVGDDLTEGEARVLMEYGWIPDSGLGTMLNYCDRVVHDRRNDNESDSSEWRSKIGKLLTDGYHGGIIVPNDIPKKVMDYGLDHTPEIKLEY